MNIHVSFLSVPHCISRSRVAALVQLQVALVGISLPTLVTNVLLAAGVDMPLVCPKVAALAEALATDVAGVRFLSSVNTQVQLQTISVVELLVAEAAGEWPLFGVRAPVRDQAALLTERLAALLAAEGTLTCVDPLVDL